MDPSEPWNEDVGDALSAMATLEECLKEYRKRAEAAMVTSDCCMCGTEFRHNPIDLDPTCLDCLEKGEDHEQDSRE